MNKLLIENDNISFDNEVQNIQIKTDVLNISIDNDVTLNEYEAYHHLKQLNIRLNSGATLIYNRFSNLENNQLEINIYLEDNTDFTGNFAFVMHATHKLYINTSMQGSSASNVLNLKMLALDRTKGIITINGEVQPNTSDNFMSEDIRVLNLNDNEIVVFPNMLISSDKVSAEHKNTISALDENKMFYLQSKGLSYEIAKKLIAQGFLLSIFNIDFIKILKNENII